MTPIFHLILSLILSICPLCFLLFFYLVMLPWTVSSLLFYFFDTCHTAVVLAVSLLLFRIVLCCLVLLCYLFHCFFTSFYCFCCFYCFNCFYCLLSQRYIRVGSTTVFPHPDLFINTLVYWSTLLLSLSLCPLLLLFKIVGCVELFDISHTSWHSSCCE
jgi:hypothetical protein